MKACTRGPRRQCRLGSRAATQPEEQEPLEEGTDLEEERWRVASTMNITGWKGGVQVASASAPVIAVQEHKLNKSRLAEESAKFKKAGRNLIGSPSILGTHWRRLGWSRFGVQNAY